MKSFLHFDVNLSLPNQEGSDIVSFENWYRFAFVCMKVSCVRQYICSVFFLPS